MALIKQKAQEKGLSLNKTIKLLLREALGLSNTLTINRRESFKEFCGVWSEQDFTQFEKNTESFNQVDPKDWE